GKRMIGGQVKLERWQGMVRERDARSDKDGLLGAKGEEGLRMWWDDCKRMKKESNKKIRQTILKKSSFMLGLTIPTGIVTLAEEEDKVHTLEFVVEVEVKDVVRATLKIKVNVTPRKTMKIMNKKVNNITNLNETQEDDVYHEEGTFFMMNHVQEMIFVNEEKYTPPKIESNSEEDDVWYFDNGASNSSLGQATISGYDISIQGVELFPSSFILDIEVLSPDLTSSVTVLSTFKALNVLLREKVPLPDVEALVLPVFVEELPVVETFFLLAEGLFLGSLLQLVDLL
ncbi:hypothetical protein Tco_1299353, partial [Tanacetum coccineum]